MGLPVTVYRWDDAGAPQMTNGRPSELINILKKCLVEGYGDKDPLGWTIPFEDAGTFKVVFQNSPTDGSGGFVQFWSHTGADTNNAVINFKGAKSMPLLDNFVSPQLLMKVSIASQSSYWIVIGTAVGFWIFTHSSLTSPNGSTYGKFNAFIGDLECFLNNDVGRFVTIFYPTAGDMTSASWNYEFTNSVNANSYLCRMYDTDGTDNFLLYRMDLRFIAGAPNVSGIPAVDRVFFKPLVVSQTGLAGSDRLGVRGSLSVIQPYYRATIPGLINCPQVGYNNQPWPIIDTINGKDHILMPGYNFGTLWIDMEEWYV